MKSLSWLDQDHKGINIVISSWHELYTIRLVDELDNYMFNVCISRDKDSPSGYSCRIHPEVKEVSNA